MVELLSLKYGLEIWKNSSNQLSPIYLKLAKKQTKPKIHMKPSQRMNKQRF